MKILELDSGLFPDSEIVRKAVLNLEGGGHTVSRIDAVRIGAEDDAAWDAVVREVMAANRVVTL